MGDKIVAGFHACVDFELVWDQKKLEDLIKFYGVRKEELSRKSYIGSERDLLLVILGHMEMGMGTEVVPETTEICYGFARHFDYRITVGGTAARAAIAVSKLGYESSLSMVCCNQLIKDRLPKEVHYYSNVGEEHKDVYPHVSFSYPGQVHIKAGNIDLITPRENRILFSRDADSLKMVISQGFAPMMKDAEVMLLSCFSEVLDQKILKERMEQLNCLLKALPETAFLLYEDGCYVNKTFRDYVLQSVKHRADALSMNEDEMQDYIGRRIDIMSPEAVLEAIQYIYKKAEIPLLIIHSASWAIAYGKNASKMDHVLNGGILSASSRFQHGDDYGLAEYKKTAELAVKQESIIFRDRITALSDLELCCIPCKDLSFVPHPVVVGLGDSFAGGLLPELTVKKRVSR